MAGQRSIRAGCAALAVELLLGACSPTNTTSQPLRELAPIDPAGLQALLEADDRPAVVNIWASWCVPCRSEAPLLDQAHDLFGDRVQFIGIAVRDTQNGAGEFIDEFGITFENYFDRDRAIPSALGRTGVPITFFFSPEGELTSTHSGVIDDRTLAINIDELLAD